MITQIKNDMAALIDTQGGTMTKTGAAFWYLYLNILMLAVFGLYGVAAVNLIELVRYGKSCMN